MDDSFRRDALARHRRYQKEVVERYAVCPWAKAARKSGRVRAHVVAGVIDASELGPLVDRWAVDRDCDVGFVIVPGFDAGIEAFDRWSAHVGKLRGDVFLSAPFHPNAPSDSGVVRFLRQTPDPTVQLVRRSRLDEVRAQDPPHYQDIFTLDLDALSSETPSTTIGASVLSHNTHLVRTHRSTLTGLLEQCGRSATAGDEAPDGADE